VGEEERGGLQEVTAKPWLTVTPQVAARMAVSTVLMATGMFYLVSGRKEADVKKMITGAMLALASIVLF
jgi:hypothetical protein